MAQKAAKTLAARNSSRLKQTHLITLVVHTFFLVLRGLVFRSSFSTRSLLLYLALSAPSLAIELWFDNIARPRYASVPSSSSSKKELRSSGEDLDAEGLTEYLWDVLYWTYGCLVLVAVGGDWLWWAWLVIPAYSIYLAYTTFTGARRGMAGLTGAGGDGAGTATGSSKRQQKMEKRGGQKVQYR